MKIIEALKMIKHLRNRNIDVVKKIGTISANLSMESTGYDNPKAQIDEWIQSIRDTNLEIEKLMRRLTYTNCMHKVTIQLGAKQVTKSLSEWLVRRSDGIRYEIDTWSNLTNKGLKSALVKLQGSEDAVMNSVVLNFDAKTRDDNRAALNQETTTIASTLEIVNATTDLMEIPE